GPAARGGPAARPDGRPALTAGPRGTTGGDDQPRSPPGTHLTSPPGLATRPSTNSRSDSRLRYLAGSGDVVSGCSSTADHAARSARRTTVRATWRWAAAGVPPGRMKELSAARSALNSSTQPSSLSMYSYSTRSGGYTGSATIGVARSAPASKRSFCTIVSTEATRSSRSVLVSATPRAALASSQSAYATRRGSFFATREKSDRPEVPSSPVRV